MALQTCHEDEVLERDVVDRRYTRTTSLHSADECVLMLTQSHGMRTAM